MDRELPSLMYTPLDSAWIGFSAASYTRAGDADWRTGPDARDEPVLTLEVLGNTLLLEDHYGIEEGKGHDQHEIEQPVCPAVVPFGLKVLARN